MTETAGLLGAMLAVQGEATTFAKDRTVKVKTKTGGEYSYSYTPLDTIVEKVGPLLHKNGLVWLTKPSWREDVGPTLKYKIAHAPSGEAEEGEMPLMLADKDAQSMGSAITYMRRYALCAVLNLVADADDDGALATANGGASQPRVLHGEATDKQRMAIRRAIKQHGLNEHVTRQVFKGAGIPVAADELLNDAINTLSKQQASTLLDEFKQGPVRTGESDAPADGSEFVHPPAQDPLPVA